MATSKENLSAINFLQEQIKKERNLVLSEYLSKVNIDTSILSQRFRNIELRKDFFGNWTISVIDEYADLDGNPISKNKKLVSRLKALWENNQKEIKFKELIDMNIFTPAKELKVQNFKLTNYSLLVNTGYYNLSLIDKNKNIDGLWLDNMINTERILEVLKDFNIKSKELVKISELDLNKLLENHFKMYFENVKKGGTSDKGLIDLIIGDLIYGIELKLARELKKTSQADRALGQIDRYIEKFGSNFMVVISGTEDDKKEKSVQDLIKKIRNSKGNYYYLEPYD